MPQKAMTAGAILVLLGLAGYVASGAESLTALIPAAIGAILLGLGLGARKESLRKHLMHIAAAVALLGVLGTISGVVKAVGFAVGGMVERPLAVASQTATAIICAWLLIAAIRSFIEARKARA